MAVKFFDEQWYLARNPDVAELVQQGGITAEQHFEQYGVVEGRSPSPLFQADYYLQQNPDVAAAVAAGETTAYAHFEANGHVEGRAASPYFNPDSYLAANPDVAAAVETGAVSAHEHFQASGIAEGRSPLAAFNTGHYLTANPDVAAAVESGQLSAVSHFLNHGIHEERSLSPVISIGAYLALHSDVQDAVEAGQTTGLAHMLTHGLPEGRDLGNGVSAAQFVNDPVYQQAIQAGNTDLALARVAEVAPFLPQFQAPEGFELPADWPIPQGFVPTEGTVLTIPEGWAPAEPARLPDYFEQPFAAVVMPGGAVAFPDATGEIFVVNTGDGQAGFAQGGFLANTSVLLNGTATIHTGPEQVLVGHYADIAKLNIGGDGAVSAQGTPEADVIDATGWNAVNLTVDAGAGDDMITIRDTQTAVGGEGADTFVVSATAGTSSVITIADYDSEQGDIVDLTEVEGFDIFGMEVRGAEHDGTGWNWDGYTGNSLGIWFSGEAANVQLTDARNDTIKFALPEIEGFEGYDTMQLSIAAGGVLRAGDEAGEILRGGDGAQLFFSGNQADVLSGGGGIDTFVVRDASKSNLNSMDRIVDFEIGEDILVSHTLVGSFHDGGALADLGAETIAQALTTDTFKANGGAYFTVDDGGVMRTFVALNDGNAGFDAAAYDYRDHGLYREPERPGRYWRTRLEHLDRYSCGNAHRRLSGSSRFLRSLRAH